MTHEEFLNRLNLTAEKVARVRELGQSWTLLTST